MANPEHLKILEQGVEAWNNWREQNRKIIPDLSEADLSEVDLRAADLSNANLQGVNLVGADLRSAHHPSGSRFYHLTTILFRTNLRGTNLFGADLRDANLRDVDLHRANLSNADLRGTSLRVANLSVANLKESILGYTVFGNTNLKNAQNLDSCRHHGPSIIDQMTLVQSGKLPEVFLKGCGLSDEFVREIPFLFWEKAAFEFYSCFISHSTKDKDFAERLYTDLQNKGVRCWFAPEDMKIGDEIRQRIDETIRVYDKLLLILSENSINSAWVKKEVETAFEKESRNNHTVLFPIRLDDQVMETATAWAADIRRTRHIGDFTNWKHHDSYQQAFQRLLRDLKSS